MNCNGNLSIHPLSILDYAKVLSIRLMSAFCRAQLFTETITPFRCIFYISGENELTHSISGDYKQFETK